MFINVPSYYQLLVIFLKQFVMRLKGLIKEHQGKQELGRYILFTSKWLKENILL
jgi:hypothetical protein